MSSPQEQEDQKVRADLQALARHVDKQLPYGWGFVVLAFPFGAGGRMNYISNAKRADIVRSMYEFIEATKEKWGEHVPEGAAAEDEELGRARQRIAELERALELLTKANADLNPTDVADLVFILGLAAEMFAASGETTWAQRALRYKEVFLKRGHDKRI
jgi:hypothetical protein